MLPSLHPKTHVLATRALFQERTSACRRQELTLVLAANVKAVDVILPETVRGKPPRAGSCAANQPEWLLCLPMQKATDHSKRPAFGYSQQIPAKIKARRASPGIHCQLKMASTDGGPEGRNGSSLSFLAHKLSPVQRLSPLLQGAQVLPNSLARNAILSRVLTSTSAGRSQEMALVFAGNGKAAGAILPKTRRGKHTRVRSSSAG